MTVAPQDLAPLAPEIVWWTPSEAYLEDPKVFLEYLHMWREIGRDKISSVYLGAQLDDPQTHVLVTVWKSLAHHQAFLEHEAYPDIGLSLMEAMVGTSKLNQVFIDGPPHNLERALSAPLTQFIYITMRPLHDIGYELVPLIQLLQTELRKVPGFISSCWGPSAEKDKLQIGIVGWTCLEARDRAVSGPLSNIIGRIKELSHAELRFSCLTRFTENLA